MSYNFQELLRDPEFVKARDRAVKFLSYRARSVFEVKEKLQSIGFSEEISDAVIELLIKNKYLNDDIFVEMYIREKVENNGYSLKRVIYELSLKGISKKSAFEIYERLMISETDTIIAVIKKRCRNGFPEDKKEYEKLINYLLQKGFGYGIIKDALQKIDLLRNPYET